MNSENRVVVSRSVQCALNCSPHPNEKMNPLYAYIRDTHMEAIVEVAADKQLTTLDLSYNDLDEVPANLGVCVRLRRLRLQFNRIQRVGCEVIV